MRQPIIQAPPSKSASHRALIASALADGESRLYNLLASQDLERTRDCLSRLGAAIREEGEAVVVRGMDTRRERGPELVELDVGESGTTCRLLAAVAALTGGVCRISGRGRMHQRPLGSLTRALERLGAKISWEGEPGCPPLVIDARGIAPGRVGVDLEQSSQFLSGLLLAGPILSAPLSVDITGERVVSWPYVALTLQVMQDFGARFLVEALQEGTWEEVAWESLTRAEPGKVRFTVYPGPYAPREYRVEGDWSNASYLLAAGALKDSGIRVRGLVPNSTQGDRRILDILRTMGAGVEISHGAIRVTPNGLRGADLDMGSSPDLVPTVAVLASLARGGTRIRNAAHLRLKESDRLGDLAGEIEKTGAGMELHPDGATILPPSGAATGPIHFQTHGDHRLAMAFALYGLAGVDFVLSDPDCVAKSFPSFWETWSLVQRDD
ncbi:MAG: 3-phosphoshikimate 1-carboxyvinyltransferase [Desulfohalobiaceae bacterium]|nr:3-phosphoshikimate 1-carboxyvinyltransferase [Desulfohalobiaceae bacterium]